MHYKQLPNIISLSRIVATVGMFFTAVFSLPFWALYIWCGISDMIDGPLARKLGAESKAGAAIDSCADFIFLVIASIKILPEISLPTWLWWVIGAIAAFQVIRMGYLYFRHGGWNGLHDLPNKILGLLLYLSPIVLASIPN